MKKTVCFLIILLLMFAAISCKSSNSKLDTVLEDDTNPYNILSYENDEIYNIQLISLKNCATYKFTYLSDGYEIIGYISIPLKCIEEQTPCKCILYNRGGNSKIGLLEDEDTSEICVETSRIVIASQYRGANGGEGYDQFGGDDLHDVIKLIDFCETTFNFTDMNDFCSIGVSRGGIMTYMAARNDERIRKIIAVSSVSDLLKSYNERDDMKKVLNNYIGGSPQELPEEYKKRSVIYWADEIKVPVLLIHSRYDESVSFSQSEELYEKFQEVGVNCGFVIHEDNIHGFHSDDKESILDFLEKQID